MTSQPCTASNSSMPTRTPPDDRLLLRNNLRFDASSDLLFCTVPGCAQAITGNAKKHAYRKHRMTVNVADAAVLDEFTALPCKYYELQAKPYPAIICLPVLDGFQCSVCYYCCTSKPSMLNHFSNQQHSENRMIPVKAQTLGRGNGSQYFAVVEVDVFSVPSIVSGRGNPDSQAIEFALTSIASNTLEAIEPNENLFYKVMNWYQNPEDAAPEDFFATIYPKEPDMIATASKLIQVLTIFTQAIFSVDYNARKIVMFDHRERALTGLQMEKSKQEYVAYWVKFLLYLFKYATGSRFGSILDSVFADVSAAGVLALIFRIAISPSTGRDPEVMNFLKYSCRTEKGRLEKASEASRRCAKLVYLFRAGFSLTMEGLPGSDRQQFFTRHRYYIERGNMSAFSMISSTQSLAMYIAGTENGVPRIVIGASVLDISIDGVRFSHTQLKSLVQQLLATMRRHMSHLLFESEIDVSELDIQDNFSIASPGYFFGASVFQDTSRYLIEKTLASNELRTRFILGIEDNKILWNAHEVFKYLQVFKAYSEAAFTLAHLSAGQPARATEINHIRLRNTGADERNVYFDNGMLLIQLQHHKHRVRALSNSQISRFLPKCVSELFIKDILYVRPFLDMMLKGSDYPNAASNVIQTYLFNKCFRVYGSEEICNVFRNQVEAHSSHSLKYSQWRQIAVYFAGYLKIFSSDDENREDEEGSEVDVFAAQANHSIAAANRHYGISANEFRNDRTHRLQSFKECSIIWHCFLGLLVAIQQQLMTAAVVPAVRRSRASTVPEPIAQAIPERKRSKALDEFSVSKAFRIGIAAQEIVSVRISKHDPLVILRQFLLNRSAVFQSVIQRATVDWILNRRMHLFSILPTGGGKSMLFLLNAHVYRHVFTVVIVPTISLQEDICRRAREVGILAHREASSARGGGLLVETVEAAVLPSFHHKLVALHNSKQLSRIFIDEVHMFTTNAKFRPAFRLLPQLLFLAVPVVLMSATAPPKVVSDILHHFFGAPEHCKIIRAPTVRKNIRYAAKNFADRVLLFEYIQSAAKSLDAVGRIIVYIPNISMIRDFSRCLDVDGLSSGMYHGQMEEAERTAAFEDWRSGVFKVIFATSAFGLGVDYPAVRYVFHYTLPFALEDFFQESGRAGRDGLLAQSWLLFDERVELRRIGRVESAGDLQRMLDYATSDGVCYRRLLSAYFDAYEVECCYDLSYVRCAACQTGLVQEVDVAADEEALEGGTRNAQDLLEADMVLAEDVMKFVDVLKSVCAYCYVVEGENRKHKLEECPNMNGRCLRCFNEGHAVERCKAMWAVKDQCQRCMLPRELGGMVMCSEWGACDKGCVRDVVVLSGLDGDFARNFVECMLKLSK
jgi:late competence protein required for DNA uptake (superfamily II DNA/RNA helicase)